MPHVVVKLWPGSSEKQKKELAEAITRDIGKILGNGADSVSVALEEVPAKEWTEKVYKPEIKDKWNTLYKEPGYDPL